MIYALIITLIVGLTLLIRGLRGRRIDDHPLCRKCGFDLIGKPQDSTRCPECGAELGGRRAIITGHRRRSIFAVTTSLLFVAVPMTIAALYVVQIEQIQWIRYTPARYLLWQLSTDGPRQKAALVELIYRTQNNRLGVADEVRALDAVLIRQADSNKPWDPLWGELLEVAERAGLASTAQWQRYCSQA